MEEDWRDVVGYEGSYMVSNVGNVRSVDRIIISKLGYERFVRGIDLALRVRNSGYVECKLCINDIRKNLSVHRLVAKAFVPNPNGYKIVNHIDAVKTNNSCLNLEWCTSLQNNLHSISLGLNPSGRGERNYGNKLPTESILNIRSLYKNGEKQSDLAEKFNISKSNIDKIVNRRTWKHLL